MVNGNNVIGDLFYSTIYFRVIVLRKCE